MQHDSRDPDEPGPDAGTRTARDDAMAAYAQALSGYIHELRTPLGAIVGAASNIEHYADRLDPKTASQLCGGIIEEAQRLDHLLTSLSVIAGAGDGAITAAPSELELNDLLLGLSHKAREHAAPAQVTLAAAAEDIMLVSDPGLLRRAVLTMLDLAAGIAPRGGRLAVMAGAGEATATVSVEGATRPEAEIRVRRLVSALAGGGPSDPGHGMGADAVFLASLRQLVHILGGRLSAFHRESDNRLGIAVELPRLWRSEHRV